jgi:Flp pilus assembly protein TadB
MAAVAPFAIVLLGIATIGLLFTSFWKPISERLEPFAQQFAFDLDLADIKIEPKQYSIVLLLISVVAWVAILILMRPSPLISIALLAGSLLVTLYLGRWWVKRRRAARVAQFREHLESALRTLAGGLRVGLGIRQALILVGEQSRDPVRHEFMRVVGLTNVGMSILDAFDQLALRMTNPETQMLARVIRVQSQTGGDLATVLDNLAGTIRDRRRLFRRISAITAQGKATGWLLGMLPLGVGAFVVLTQPLLRDAMLYTLIGRILLAISLALDALAIYFLLKIVKGVDP